MIKKLFGIFHIVLITLAVFFCVQLFYQLVSATALRVPYDRLLIAQAPENMPSSVSMPDRMRANPGLNAYQAIFNRDLFKTVQVEPAQKKADDIELEKLKQTQLNLKLWGTVTGSETRRAYAVIEDLKNRQQSLYREGDAIQNAQIKLILRKKVVLSVNGKDEILLMEEEKNQRAMASASAPSSRDTGMPEEPEYTYGSEADQSTVSIDREEINSALKNINQLMSQVKVRPHFENGQPSGLIVSHIRPKSIFSEMGLQNGDIVKGVNGNQIQSVDDALKFYENLKSSSSVDLQIERGGELMSIAYQIQ